MGRLECRVCSTNFESKISGKLPVINGLIELSQPVDVYCDWIDACHKINKNKAQVEGY